MALCRATGDRASVHVDDGTAEELQPVHGDSGDNGAIHGRSTGGSGTIYGVYHRRTGLAHPSSTRWARGPIEVISKLEEHELCEFVSHLSRSPCSHRSVGRSHAAVATALRRLPKRCHPALRRCALPSTPTRVSRWRRRPVTTSRSPIACRTVIWAQWESTSEILRSSMALPTRCTRRF